MTVVFEPGKRYRRRELHLQYGGQWQGGISTPQAFPMIFLFTGEPGTAYGYHDGWDVDGTFQYFGEGQVGDMQFQRGNLAVRDHALNGKDLHLFSIDGRAFVRYLGQMVCTGYELWFGVPDKDGNPRTAIVFKLVPSE